MLKMIFLLLAVAAISCDGSAQETVTYGKNDLKKIKWIEGKWKGLYQGKPFYEIYRFVNDSTLETIGYEWDGKDSSKTTRGYLYFKNGAYYLGDKQNWKVISITEKEIKMLPNVEAYNDVLWRYKDSANWDAILTTPKGTTVYNMQYFDPFKK